MSNLDSKNHGWLYGKRPDAAPALTNDDAHTLRNIVNGFEYEAGEEVRDFLLTLADKIEKRVASDAAPVARDMICESHPWLPWPHGKCGGPGCPVGAKDLLLRDRISGLQQAVKQRETMIADFYYATEDAPVKSAVHQIPDKRCPECVLKIGDADGTQVESANDFLEHGGHFDGCSRKRLVHKQNCRTRIDPECGICDCE